MRRARAVALLVAAAMAVGACSGDDDGGDDRAGDATTTSSFVFTGDPGSPFCVRLRELELQGLLDRQAESAADIAAGFATVIEVLGQLADLAPEELREDVALVLAGVGALDAALREVGYSYDALSAQPDLALEVSRAANDPAFGVANARIRSYEEQVCAR